MTTSPLIPSADPRYEAFARELIATGIIGDPWIYGRERFRIDPVVLTGEQWSALARAAEAIAVAFDEGVRIVLDNPDALDGYFHLTPWQKGMWLASGGRWHGIARQDLFVLPDGSIQCCEMNSDTPSGEAETVILNRIIHREHQSTIDPNEQFPERFVELVRAMTRAAGGEARCVGIVYPTDMTEDLSMISIYRDWMESRGIEVVIGGPHNLGAQFDALTLFGRRVDAVIRHYKTDWWGERFPAWSDEMDYEDPDPLARPLRLLLAADRQGAAAVINPFGSVLTQNKLMMAFLWDNLDRLSDVAASAVREHIPETRRLVDVDTATLARDEWVLKSDYGCEGDEVIIGRDVADAMWRASLEAVVPERWIVQRYFAADPDLDGFIPNYGVYLLGGLASGIFTRLSARATDTTALSAATLISPDPETGTGRNTIGDNDEDRTGTARS